MRLIIIAETRKVAALSTKTVLRPTNVARTPPSADPTAIVAAVVEAESEFALNNSCAPHEVRNRCPFRCVEEGRNRKQTGTDNVNRRKRRQRVRKQKSQREQRAKHICRDHYTPSVTTIHYHARQWSEYEQWQVARNCINSDSNSLAACSGEMYGEREDCNVIKPIADF